MKVSKQPQHRVAATTRSEATLEMFRQRMTSYAELRDEISHIRKVRHDFLKKKSFNFRLPNFVAGRITNFQS